jgi:hypothetical protein
MRQAFLIGAIFLWLGINILGNIADQQALLSQVDAKTGLTQKQTMEELRKPEVTDANMYTIFSKIGKVLITVGKIFTLWHPALWQGWAIYIYYFVLAIGASFWVVLVLAIRGVGSG